MKKLFFISLAILSSWTTYSQTMPTLLEDISAPYMDIIRIRPDYIAGLRNGNLDVRMAPVNSLGTVAATIPISSIPVMGARLEHKANTVYAISSDITVIDVSAPESPVLTATIALPEQSLSTHIWNDLLLVSCDNNHTYIYDISTPNLPLLTDSADMLMSNIVRKNNKLYTHKNIGYKMYSWQLSTNTPYLTLKDSLTLYNSVATLSFTIANEQLIAKTLDTLYRFDLNAPDDFHLLTKEDLPEYAYNAYIVAIDTNYIGYAKYNSFSMSYGSMGNSFTDTFHLGYVDYYIGYGKLDNCIFYGDVTSTYLIGFEGSTGIEIEPNETTTSIYPNPTKDYLHIQTDQSQKYAYKLTDMHGRVLQSVILDPSKKTIDLQTLPTGIYFLQLQNEKTHLTKKIVKY